MSRAEHVTAHAIERYQQRVENIPASRVEELLSTECIIAAIKFGATRVILPTGHRLVIAGQRIVTVAPKPRRPKCRRGKPPNE